MTRKELPEIKRLFINAIIFLTIFVTFDFLVGKAVVYYIRHKQISTFTRLENAKYHQSDVLIFGASQGELGYNPQLISKVTSYNTTNLSTSSSNSSYSFILLRDFIKYHIPKFVIFEATQGDLFDNPKFFTNTARLRHLYGKDKSIDSVLIAINPFSRISLLSNLYKYNLLIIDILRNRRAYNTSDKYIRAEPDNGKGLDALLEMYRKKPLQDWFLQFKLNESAGLSGISFQSFNNIIKLCRENNIKLLIINSPKYFNNVPSLGEMKTPDYFKNLPQDSIVSFHDISFNNYPYFKEKKYYKDLVHLNAWGADSLSTIVSRIILENSGKNN